MAGKRSGKKWNRGNRSKKWIQGNIHLVLFFRLLVVLLLFLLSRLLFFLFNFNYFSDAGSAELAKLFLLGFRFDISAILIINAPFILMYIIPTLLRGKTWYLVLADVFFYSINIVALLSNFVDVVYFRFTLKRTTADIFRYLGVGGDFDKLVPQFLQDFWYLLAICILFCTLFVWLCTRFIAAGSGGNQNKKGVQYYFIHSLLFLIIGFFSVIGIRGGFQLRPISLVTSGEYTSAKYIPLLLNTPFAIIKTSTHKPLMTVSYFKKEEELAKIYDPIHMGKHGQFKQLNVMIIIMESFSREHIGALNKNLENGKYKGFTPFLDSLIGKGVLFNGFANGKTSIQGIPAVLSGIPSLMNESFIQSNYSTDKQNSFASLLNPKGYVTAFFHGGTNGTMGFDSYTKFAGFDYYFGRKEYNNENDYDGSWGIRDEEFFQYTARTIDRFPKPFMAAVFSLSSHHPYFVPAKYANKFRKGKLPIQQSIMYSDYSLGKFFETVSKMSWFDNTLFVITADHTSEGYYPYYMTSAGQYAIPILFYRHNTELPGTAGKTAQQTDIFPTVMAYLGYDKDFLAFGNNLFDPLADSFSIYYVSGIYGLIKDGYLLEFDGESTTALYNIESDILEKNNLVQKNTDEKLKLEPFIKAYIQQYNNRIIENRLTVE